LEKEVQALISSLPERKIEGRREARGGRAGAEVGERWGVF
jgi:hypothetical protein